MAGWEAIEDVALRMIARDWEERGPGHMARTLLLHPDDRPGHGAFRTFSDAFWERPVTLECDYGVVDLITSPTVVRGSVALIGKDGRQVACHIPRPPDSTP